MAKLLIRIIAVYRYCISPVLISHCRFYPTCSQYAQEALRNHGFYKGLWLSCKRILRCHPFNEGGIDLVPEPIEINKS